MTRAIASFRCLSKTASAAPISHQSQALVGSMVSTHSAGTDTESRDHITLHDRYVRLFLRIFHACPERSDDLTEELYNATCYDTRAMIVCMGHDKRSDDTNVPDRRT